MHALEHTVPAAINLGHSLTSWSSPCQKNHPSSPLLCYNIDDFLGEFLPAFVRMAIGFMGSDSQTRI